MSDKRLIDAEELKATLKQWFPPFTLEGLEAKTLFKLIIHDIDNAPTEARPHGEWEEPFENNGKTYHKCNRCHISSELILIDRFCPSCGAYMWKGGQAGQQNETK